MNIQKSVSVDQIRVKPVKQDSSLKEHGNRILDIYA